MIKLRIRRFMEVPPARRVALEAAFIRGGATAEKAERIHDFHNR
jgi:hypothetical protein